MLPAMPAGARLVLSCAAMLTRFPLITLIASSVTLAGCGSGPTAPPPVATYSVGVALFYDENGNGTLDAAESVRISDAVIEIGGKQGRSAPLTGEAIIEGVPAGSQTLAVRPSSLPPFYERPAPVTLVVPQTAGTAFLPVTLPIGSNRPNTYLAFGDSITDGEGSSDGNGYASRLQRKLQERLGRATIIKDGLAGTRSNRGLDRLLDSLTVRPAYTLIHYGTNDWNVGECKFNPPCFTIDSLRAMVREVKGRQGLPVLATIIPGNPAYLETQPARNEWVAGMDVRIREMARTEGAVVADLEPAFLHAPAWPALFTDHIHPNDAGYEVMAQVFFDAIVHPATSATDFGGPQLFKRPGF
jgi:lysophospholipase L1-like esterase